MNGATQGRRPWPPTLRRPTSSSSGWARSAASPRCRSRSAGLDVIGLEAGTWLSPRDFAPDELRNNFRGWPQAVQKANARSRRIAPNASAPHSPRAAHSSDDERRRRHDAALLGAELAAQPVGLQGGERDHAPLRRVAHPEGSTVEDWPFGLEELEPYYDKVEYESASPARPATSTARSIRAATSSRGRASASTRCRRCAAPSSPTRWRRRRAALGWHPFPGPAAINSQTYQDRPGCVYHGYCNRGGCHVDAKGSTAVTTIPQAQETGRLKVVTQAHVTSDRRRRRSGRVRGVNYLKGGEEYFQPAEVVLLAGYTYENVAAAAALEIEGVPERARRTTTARSAGTTSATTQGAPSPRCSRSTSTTGTACRRRASRSTIGRTTTSIMAALDFIGGGNLWVYSDRRPIARRQHEHIWPGADVGLGMEGVHQGECRSLEHRLPAEDDAALRGQLSRSRSRR